MTNLRSSLLLRSVAIIILTFFMNQAQAQVQTAKYVSMGPNTNGYYEYLPQGYSSNTNQTYPLILFIHGVGELGNGSQWDLPRLLYTGLAASINVGELPVSLNVNGQSHSFIVISPQFINWPNPIDSVCSCAAHIDRIIHPVIIILPGHILATTIIGGIFYLDAIHGTELLGLNS